MKTKMALCMGINNYPGVDADLEGCVADAEDWSSLLKEKGFAVKSLLDEFATRENILSNIKYLVSRPVDSVVITYSGHGTQVPDKSGDEADKMDEAWVPHDIYTNGPIYDDELFTLLRKVGPKTKIVLISDSCHSGTMLRAFEMPYVGKKKFLPNSRFMKQATPDWADPKGVGDGSFIWPCLLLSGCQDSEFSYDTQFEGKPNGAFTYWAIKQLKRLPETATYFDWYRAIRKKLPSNANPQSPNIIGTYQNIKIFS